MTSVATIVCDIPKVMLLYGIMANIKYVITDMRSANIAGSGWIMFLAPFATSFFAKFL